MMQKATWLTLALFLVWAPARAQLTQITSTFDTDAEGWRIFGDAQGASVAPSYDAAGQYIYAVDDVAGGTWYFQAPDKFLGNQFGAYGQILSFELQQSSTNSQFNNSDVVLVGQGPGGGTLSLHYDTPSNPGTTWTPYAVSLNEAGWHKGSLSGAQATREEMLAVLSSLTALRIRGEYRSGADTGSLDNVVMNTTGELPVELVSFEARASADTVQLAWRTAGETNNAGFEVQWRTQEAAWQVVGFVAGHGTTAAPQAYRYRIGPLAPGRYTFRLRQVDYDGAFAYSPEVEVAVAVPTAYVLSAAFPNPFNPRTRFTLAVQRTQQVAIGVYDLAGRRVAHLHEGLLSGATSHAFTFEAAGLPAGTYLIQVTGETFQAVRPVTLAK